MENSEEFIQEHLSNINKFKKIAVKVLEGEDGKYVFDYVTKHHQFDPINGPRSITEEQVKEIEEIYPNCFI